MTQPWYRSGYRLAGLVVKASASGAEDPGFESRLRRDVSVLSHTSDLKIGTPGATLPSACHYGVSARTGRSGVFFLRESETSLAQLWGCKELKSGRFFLFFSLFFFFSFSFSLSFFTFNSSSFRHHFPFLFFFFFSSSSPPPLPPLSLFLGVLYIFKGIIYKTLCLLNASCLYCSFSFQRVVMFLSWISFSKIIYRLLTVSVFFEILIHIFATKIM